MDVFTKKRLLDEKPISDIMYEIQEAPSPRCRRPWNSLYV